MIHHPAHLYAKSQTTQIPKTDENSQIYVPAEDWRRMEIETMKYVREFGIYGFLKYTTGKVIEQFLEF